MKNIFINGKQTDDVTKILKIIEFDDINQNVIPIFEKQQIKIKEIDLVDNIEKDSEK